jgi:hypothetical protein
VRTVLLGRVSALRHAVSLASHPITTHRAPWSLGPTRQPLASAPRASCRPPRSHANAAARARRPRADAGRPSCSPPHPGPLSLSPLFRPPRVARPSGPPSSASPPPLQKVARRRRARLSFSLPRSPPCTAKRPASHPRQRPSHRGPHRRVSDSRRCYFFSHGETLPNRHHFLFWSRPYLPHPPL